MAEPQKQEATYLYQLPPLTQAEFMLLLSLTYIGAQLVTHKVDDSFNTLWGRAEYVTQLSPSAFGSLVQKLNQLDQQAQANAAPSVPVLS